MPRGRPKKVTGEYRELDIRVTPPDQNPCMFMLEDETDFEKLIVCQEGEPNGSPRLHYHIYAKTLRSDTWLKAWIYRLARSNEQKGNSVLSIRVAHGGTLGYVVKHEQFVVTKGFAPEELATVVEHSRQYRKSIETERKTKSRNNLNTMNAIMEAVASQLDPLAPGGWSPRLITEKLLSEYRQRKLLLPPRSQIERQVLTILYDSDQSVQSTIVDHYTPLIYKNNF